MSNKSLVTESITPILPLTIHITWTFPPRQLAKFYDALYPLKEKLILEPECVYFNAFMVAGKPGVVKLVEMWDCEMEWMVQVQSQKEYYKNFFEMVNRLALEPQKVEVMSEVEGFRFVEED